MKKIIVNENDIRKIVKSVLQELHRGQQMVLPFDGSSEPYNYMQFIEYLENIGKVGKLRGGNLTAVFQREEEMAQCGFATMIDTDEVPFDEDITDFINRMISRYGEDIVGYGPDSIQDINDLLDVFTDRDKIYNELVEMGKKEIELLRYDLTINDNGLIYCERVLLLPHMDKRYNEDNIQGYYTPLNKRQDFYTELKQAFDQGVGVCWTYCPGAGECYNGGYFGQNGSRVTLKGWVRPEDVDWYETVMHIPLGELEIRMAYGATIQLDAVSVQDNQMGTRNLPIKHSILIPA
jgi:hypothetical protein